MEVRQVEELEESEKVRLRAPISHARAIGGAYELSNGFISRKSMKSCVKMSWAYNFYVSVWTLSFFKYIYFLGVYDIYFS